MNTNINELTQELEDYKKNVKSLSQNLLTAKSNIQKKVNELKQITESRDQLKSIMDDYDKLYKLKKYFDELESQKESARPEFQLAPVEKSYIGKQKKTLETYLKSVKSLTDVTSRQRLALDLINNYLHLFDYYKKDKNHRTNFDKIKNDMNVNPNRTDMAMAIMNIGNKIIDSNKKGEIDLDQLKSHDNVNIILPNFTLENDESEAEEVDDEFEYNKRSNTNTRPKDNRPRPRSPYDKNANYMQQLSSNFGGSIQNYDYNLSSRSIDRLQNVGVFNIVKFLRLGYYNNSSEKETIESLIFKDYLITIIISIVLHSLRLNKLSIGVLVDQILSMGMYYKYKNEKFLLLPYYLPFV